MPILVTCDGHGCNVCKNINALVAMARAKRIVRDETNQPIGQENERRTIALHFGTYHQVREQAGSCM